MNDAKTKLVTLPVNGCFQPVLPAFQYRNETGRFYADECSHVVDCTYPDGEVITFKGFLSLEAAKYYARSADNGGFPRATVRETEPYWHVRNFGEVK